MVPEIAGIEEAYQRYETLVQQEARTEEDGLTYKQLKDLNRPTTVSDRRQAFGDFFTFAMQHDIALTDDMFTLYAFSSVAHFKMGNTSGRSDLAKTVQAVLISNSNIKV